jgi:hypothetical protein
MMIPKRNHKPVMLTECYRYIRYLPTKNEKYCRHLNHLNGGGLKLWDVQRQLANLRIWLMWYTNLTRHIRNSSFRVFCAYFLKHTLWRSLAIKHGWFWIPRGLYNALNHHSSFVECTISISKGPEFWWSVIDVQYSVWSTPIWFFDVDGWNPMLLVYSFLPIGAIQTAIFPLGSPLPGMAVATFQVRAAQEAAAHQWGDPWQGKSQKIVQVAGGLCLYVQHFAIQISCVCVSVRVFAWFACSPSRYVSVEDLMSLSSDVLHGFTKFWGNVWVCLWVSLLQTSRFCWWSMSHDFPCLSHNSISWYIMHFREKSLQVLQPLWMATHNGFRQTLLMDGGIRCLWPVHDRASLQSWAPVFG